jgi:hypothetical protein
MTTVDGTSIQDRQALCPVAGFRHLVAGVSERFCQGDPQVGFVVYEQDCNGTCVLSLSENDLEAGPRQRLHLT